jgi:hypothetical protein
MNPSGYKRQVNGRKPHWVGDHQAIPYLKAASNSSHLPS